MNNAIAMRITNATTLSSVEISKITSKRHSDVLKDIDKMFKELALDSTSFSAQYKDDSGKTNRMYILDKELSITLVSGYNVLMRNAIIKRRQELENRPMSTSEIILQQALMNVEIEKKLELHDQQILELQAKTKTSEYDYYTVSGYCSLKSLKIPLTESGVLGKKCTKLSEELDYKVSKIYDQRYGTVNVYHIDILSQIIK